jgi:hypothetical protein
MLSLLNSLTCELRQYPISTVRSNPQMQISFIFNDLSTPNPNFILVLFVGGECQKYGNRRAPNISHANAMLITIALVQSCGRIWPKTKLGLDILHEYQKEYKNYYQIHWIDFSMEHLHSPTFTMLRSF